VAVTKNGFGPGRFFNLKKTSEKANRPSIHVAVLTLEGRYGNQE